MPLYDYKCDQCDVVTETIRPSDCQAILCPECKKDKMPAGFPDGIAWRQLSCPGGISVNGKMVLSERQMKMIKEPVWQFPDGHIESAH